MTQSTSSTPNRFSHILNLFSSKKEQPKKEQTGNLYKDLQKLPILRFWEIVKNNNYLLLDVDYVEGKEYSQNQISALDKLWGELYNEYYALKKNHSSVKAMDACTASTLLLSKIELLKNHLNAFVNLYENHQIIPDKDFVKLKQEFLHNFTLLEPKIVPEYFGSLEKNYELVIRFIESLEMTYALENPKAEKLVEDEVANVHKRAAKVGEVLSGMYLKIEDMSVMAWEGYEQTAIEKLENQNNGK